MERNWKKLCKEFYHLNFKFDNKIFKSYHKLNKDKFMPTFWMKNECWDQEKDNFLNVTNFLWLMEE